MMRLSDVLAGVLADLRVDADIARQGVSDAGMKEVGAEAPAELPGPWEEYSFTPGGEVARAGLARIRLVHSTHTVRRHAHSDARVRPVLVICR